MSFLKVLAYLLLENYQRNLLISEGWLKKLGTNTTIKEGTYIWREICASSLEDHDGIGNRGGGDGSGGVVGRVAAAVDDEICQRDG